MQLARLSAALGGQSLGDVYLRRVKRRALLRRGLGALAGAACVADVVVGPGHLSGDPRADIRTRHGETQQLALGARSTATLAPCSAIAFAAGGGRNAFTLLRGTVLVESRPDAASPFIQVATRAGTVRALAGDFMVRRDDGRTIVTAHDDMLTILPAHGPRLTLAAGHAIDLEPNGPGEQAIDWGLATSWRNGMLIVENGTLGDVVAGLAPYWRGALYITPRAARIRASGVFSLNDTRRSLTQLEEIFPVSIRHLPFGVVTINSLS
ncbi:FecR domain-containing protein [Nguyenibacter vanlangensis]|uniref:FecR domain-containing protein n=1 Tax=Nguyenibacter vanlangensis TaxID=1216886 RepID=A0ABZ3D5E2_9PROT